MNSVFSQMHAFILRALAVLVSLALAVRKVTFLILFFLNFFLILNSIYIIGFGILLEAHKYCFMKLREFLKTFLVLMQIYLL